MGDGFSYESKKDSSQLGFTNKIGQFSELKLAEIALNPNQPRKRFNEKKMLDLTRSIAKDGVLQPVLVRKEKDSGGYRLVAGERRFRAVLSLGGDRIPAVVLEDESYGGAIRAALVENLQRHEYPKGWFQK